MINHRDAVLDLSDTPLIAQGVTIRSAKTSTTPMVNIYDCKSTTGPELNRSLVGCRGCSSWSAVDHDNYRWFLCLTRCKAAVQRLVEKGMCPLVIGGREIHRLSSRYGFVCWLRLSTNTGQHSSYVVIAINSRR